jgi:putative ABC transport system permease protein
MNTLLRDLRYAIRGLARSPGFTAVAVVTLAVAIGVNSAIFSIVNGLILRPVVSYKPWELVNIFTARKAANRDYRQFSYAEFSALRESNPVLSDVAALGFTLAGVGRGDDVRRSVVFFGSDNLLPLLGARPAAGRFFAPAETRPNAGIQVAVASYALWQRMGGRPDFVGSSLELNGQRFTVIGVTPRGFTGVNAVIMPDLWLPLGVHTLFNPIDDASEAQDLNLPTTYALNLIGRLQPGLSVQSAEPLLGALETRLDAVQPPETAATAARELQLETPSRFSLGTNPSGDGPVGKLAGLVLGMAGVVLLIACLNLVNMLLARGTGRAREFAVRLSLGATRWRVVRQLLIEGLALALAGGALGFLIALWSNDLLAQSINSMFRAMGFSFAIDLRPDVTALGATFLFCIAATLMFSLGPALKSARTDVAHDLKQQTGEPALAGRWNRSFSARHCLVMAQIALSLVLLFGGGLFLRGAFNAAGLKPGFDTTGGIVAEMDFTLTHLDAATTRQKTQAALARVQALPGVRHAALATLLPYGNITYSRRIISADAAPAVDPKAPQPGFDGIFTAITPDYFDTLGVRLLRGRTFTNSETERRETPPVAIIDERMAESLFPHEDALGRRIRYTTPPSDGSPAEMEVIGVVSSFRHEASVERPRGRLFVPFAQSSYRSVYVNARLATTSPKAVLASVGTVRNTLRMADPDLPVLRVMPFAGVITGNLDLWVVKLGAVMFGAFGGIALLLAVVGVYGVKAYAVTRRAREIGIRMALGATSANVLALIMRQAALQTVIAVAAGTALALLLGKALSSVLFDVAPADPLVLGGVVVVLVAATLLASYVPARRATRVDPMKGLRCE